MASRIMHVCIGEMLYSKYNLNRNRFLLGNIAPDAYGAREFKKVSHFTLQTPDEKTKHYFDTAAFLEKYKNSLHDDFFLGYYCHLLSDEIFWGMIYNKYVKPYDPEEQLLRLKKCYHDFRILNGRIIERYSIDNNFYFFEDFSLNEIDMNCFRNIFNYLIEDFLLVNPAEEELLQIYEYEDIEGFLNEAAGICNDKLSCIINTRH